MEKTQIEVNCSSFNLLNKGTLPLLALPVEFWVSYAKAMGYGGIEWRPLRSQFVPEAQILNRALSPYARNGIRSVEQSFRTEKTWKEACEFKDPIKRQTAQQTVLLLPPRVVSIRNMMVLQRAIGNRPATIYPTDDRTKEGSFERRQQQGVFHKLVQPGDEVVEKWRVKSFDAMLDGFEARDLNINLDLTHYLRLRRHFKLPSMDEALLMMFPMIKEVQFSAKRDDLGEGDTDSALAHLDLLDGTLRSEAAQMCANLVSMGYKGPLVCEVAGSTSANNPVQLFKDNRRYSSSIKKIAA